MQGAGGLELHAPQQGDTAWEMCMMAGAGSCNASAAASAAPTPGGWATASAKLSAKDTVTVSAPSLSHALAAEAGGAVLVRYAWAAVPFQYKAAGLYAKTEGLPAGPFVVKTGSTEYARADTPTARTRS